MTAPPDNRSLLPAAALPLLATGFFGLAVAPVLVMLSAAGADGTSGGLATIWDPGLLKPAQNSLTLGVGAAAGALLLGLPQALLLERVRVPGRRFFHLAYLVPLLIPPYIQALGWARLLAPRGAVAGTLAAVGVPRSLRPEIQGLWGAVFVLSLAYAPLVTLFVRSGLRAVDRGMEDAARTARPPAGVLLGVTLPLVRPHILCGALFVFVFALVDFGVPDFLGVRVYATEIFIRFSAFYDPRGAAALTLPLVAVTLLMVAAVRAVMGDRPFVRVAVPGDPPPAEDPGTALRWIGFSFLAALAAVSTLAPLGPLAAGAADARVVAAVLKDSREAIGCSLALAAAGALLLVPFSFLLAYLMERASRRGAAMLDWLTLAPLAVPGTVTGIGLITLWNRPAAQWLYGTTGMVILAYLAHFTPYTVRLLHAGMRQVDPRLEEAARLSVARHGTILLRVVAGMLRPTLLAAAFCGFVLCFRDLSVTLLVMPPGLETVPVRIYNLMHYGAEERVAALSLVVAGIILALGAAVAALLRGGRK